MDEITSDLENMQNTKERPLSKIPSLGISTSCLSLDFFRESLEETRTEFQ